MLRKILKFIWGWLPIVILLGIILILAGNIGEKKSLIEDRKKGLKLLEGQLAASEKMMDVINIFSSSKDIETANKTLAKQFGMTPRQAKAVSQMPLENLTASKQNKIRDRINKLKKDLSENATQTIKETPPVNVVTMELKPRTIRDRINLPGIIEPWIKLDVLTEVRGEVKKKVVKEGEKIRKGALLLVIDSRKYENTLKSIKASHESALASKNRIEGLYKEKLARKSDLDSIKAQVKSLKAAMDNAAYDMERCIIKAPISGIVNKVYIEKGQYLNPSNKVVEIIQIDKVKVKTGIPESDVSAVRKLTDFEVSIEALDGKVFKAKKYFLSNTAEPMARLYSLDLVVENSRTEILPDMFARVEIVKEIKPGSISVPLYSVVSIKNRHIVYIEENGTAYSKDVEIGIQEGWWVEITKGLMAGEHVLVKGQRSVYDDQKVKVVQVINDPEDLN